MRAVSPGDYFFIKYSQLKLLGMHDETMKNIINYYQDKAFKESIPWCDFKIYRKERNLRDIFI